MDVSIVNVLASGAGLWFAYNVLRYAVRRRATVLKGPPSKSFLFGLSEYLLKVPDPSVVYDEWSHIYGAVFQIPTEFGGTRVVVCDPKAIAHVLGHETSTYVKPPLWRAFMKILFGVGLVTAEGESHKRQRRLLSPAFTTGVIRRLISVFFDSSYKLKSKWDAQLEGSSGRVLIDVEYWMKAVTIDTLGIAGFGHDFRSLDGDESPVFTTLRAAGKPGRSTLPIMLAIVASRFPFLLQLPFSVNKSMARLRAAMDDISGRIFEKTRAENAGEKSSSDRSMISALVASEGKLSKAEISAQMNTVLLGGFDTTAVRLVWALVEMCKHPEVQRRLRDELLQFGGTDPTLDQLNTELPYLDAVIHEVLRVHPPILETLMMAAQDDVIPLGAPLTTATGDTVSHIFVRKGTEVRVPTACVNLSEEFWGPTAKEFKPERWLDGGMDVLRSKEIHGHRHLLTFSDGPRTCIGKHFALNNFKIILYVLIRNFVFEFPDGPDTQIESYVVLGAQPKVAGAKGSEVPMYVKRVE